MASQQARVLVQFGHHHVTHDRLRESSRFVQNARRGRIRSVEQLRPEGRGQPAPNGSTVAPTLFLDFHCVAQNTRGSFPVLRKLGIMIVLQLWSLPLSEGVGVDPLTLTTSSSGAVGRWQRRTQLAPSSIVCVRRSSAKL